MFLKEAYNLKVLNTTTSFTHNYKKLVLQTLSEWNLILIITFNHYCYYQKNFLLLLLLLFFSSLLL